MIVIGYLQSSLHSYQAAFISPGSCAPVKARSQARQGRQIPSSSSYHPSSHMAPYPCPEVSIAAAGGGAGAGADTVPPFFSFSTTGFASNCFFLASTLSFSQCCLHPPPPQAQPCFVKFLCRHLEHLHQDCTTLRPSLSQIAAFFCGFFTRSSL